MFQLDCEALGLRKGLKRRKTKQSKDAFQAGFTQACGAGKANGLLKRIKKRRVFPDNNLVQTFLRSALCNPFVNARNVISEVSGENKRRNL